MAGKIDTVLSWIVVKGHKKIELCYSIILLFYYWIKTKKGCQSEMQWKFLHECKDSIQFTIETSNKETLTEAYTRTKNICPAKQQIYQRGKYPNWSHKLLHLSKRVHVGVTGKSYKQFAEPADIKRKSIHLTILLLGLHLVDESWRRFTSKIKEENRKT